MFNVKKKIIIINNIYDKFSIWVTILYFILKLIIFTAREPSCIFYSEALKTIFQMLKK